MRNRRFRLSSHMIQKILLGISACQNVLLKKEMIDKP